MRLGVIVLLSSLTLGCPPRAPEHRHGKSPAPTELTRLAGQPGGFGHVDGTLAAAHFQDPWQLACDGHGHVYMTEDGKQVIRRIDLDAGQVDTLAGTPMGIGATDGIGAAAEFWGPSQLALDGDRLYVADVEHNLLRVVDIAARSVRTLGDVKGGWRDGPLATAMFNEPEGVFVDGGMLYVGDTDDDMIRKIDLARGVVSTLAGDLPFGFADGIGKAARFHKPMFITGDHHGNLYVADILNRAVRVVRERDGAVSTLAKFDALTLGLLVDGDRLLVSLSDNRIVAIDRQSGVVTNWLGVAGKGAFADGNAKEARFSRPAGMCLDGKGHVILGDSGNFVVRSIELASGNVTTIAGVHPAGARDGDGASARFDGPQGIVWDGVSNAWLVADSNNSTIRRVDGKTGATTTIAGAAGIAGNVDGIGSAARFDHPQGVALDGRGHLYVADSGNRVVRVVTLASGAVETFSPAPDRLLRLTFPTGVAVAAGALFIVDYDASVVFGAELRDPRLAVVAGAVGQLGLRDGKGGAARFNHPQAIAYGGGDALFVGDAGNQAIRRLGVKDHRVTTLAQGFNHPTHLAADGDGDVFVSDAYNNVVKRVSAAGETRVLVGSLTLAGVQLGPLPAQLYRPGPLALDGDGRLAIVAEDTILVAK
jgi:sugar lactone lactonase YvrE